jgi:hypothetical protein
LKLVALGSVGGQVVLKYHYGVGDICRAMRAVSDFVQKGYALYIYASFNSGGGADDTNPNPQILMHTLLQLCITKQRYAL